MVLTQSKRDPLTKYIDKVKVSKIFLESIYISGLLVTPNGVTSSIKKISFSYVESFLFPFSLFSTRVALASALRHQVLVLF